MPEANDRSMSGLCQCIGLGLGPARAARGTARATVTAGGYADAPAPRPPSSHKSSATYYAAQVVQYSHGGLLSRHPGPMDNGPGKRPKREAWEAEKGGVEKRLESGNACRELSTL